MANDLDYQKARRIRGTGFADLLSDQLSGNSTIRGAIGKTISLKTQAKVKGFKEKFDPLNIAKFLTGGSSLGPALLGKITGRSEKDIQYFSGRMRPIRERGTASKLGRGPATGGSEGVNEMLRKIYYLMQITRESDLERSDKELNFAEEKKIEAEKRHKELLKALTNLNKDTTATEEKNIRGLLDTLMDLLSGIPGIPSAKRIGRGGKLARSILSGLSGAAISFLSSPAFILAAAPTVLAIMVSKEKEEIEEDPFNPKYDNNPYALSLRKGTEAGQEAKKNIAKASRQQDTARRGEIQMALDSKTPDDVLMSQYGADEKTLSIWLSDPKNQLWKRPDNVPRTPLPDVVPPAPKVPVEIPSIFSPEEIVPMYKVATTSGFASPVSEPSMASMASSDMASPAAVPGTNLTARLGAATTENLNSSLPSSKPAPASVVNNVNSSQQKSGQNLPPALDTISVRNMDPTFMRMIMDSTRVV